VSGMAAMARWMAEFLVMTRENSAWPRTQARTTARLPWAESPRTRIFPVAPAARAVAIAWAIMRPAPLPEPVFPPVAASRRSPVRSARC